MDPDHPFLAPGAFIDSDHPAVVAFARAAIGDADRDAVKASRLFRAVREQTRYDPYTVSFDRDAYRASHVLTTSRAYCIPKAILLAAAGRAVGLPARIGFADVRNHISSPRLIELLGSDLFIFHGYTELWIDGRAYKFTPAFNASLCARAGVPPLEFDPDAPADALLQPFDGEGQRYMEYVADRGVFDDLPFERIMTAFRTTYPRLHTAATAVAPDDVFRG